MHFLRLALPIDPTHVPTAQLSVEVFDYDLVGANDPIGAIVPIPVDRLTRRWGRRAWFPLVPPGATTDGGAASEAASGGASATTTTTTTTTTGELGEVELCFRLHFNPAIQRFDATDDDAGASRPLVRKVVEVKQSLMDNPLLDVSGDIPAPVREGKREERRREERAPTPPSCKTCIVLKLNF